MRSRVIGRNRTCELNMVWYGMLVLTCFQEEQGGSEKVFVEPRLCWVMRTMYPIFLDSVAVFVLSDNVGFPDVSRRRNEVNKMGRFLLCKCGCVA